ncbi:MAG TPA: alpha/beta hydrolase [Acidimicrobiia bacterium]|nr:alpha/beta hydrolase [Acidimicrobiia bacterium]
MTVYLSHATSFCGAVWRPVMNRLGDVETVAWDQPGHGNGPNLTPPFGWETFGEYVLEVTEPGGVGVGHSMGAAALVMAQIADPSRFRALVLVEPVMFSGPYEKVDNAMSQTALRRRREFESRREAAESFRGRGAFVGWDEDAFAGYIECGLTGDGPVNLACDPEVEAEIYRGSGAHRTWERAGEIEVPVLLMSGRLSETIRPEFARAQAAQLGGVGLEIVDDAGHFLPMERPDLVADRVRRLMEAVG